MVRSRILPPKRHHTTPILHLKHFTDANGQVWAYDAETSDTRPAAPRNTAVQTHFYSAEGVGGTMDTRLEEYLAKVESAAAPVYEALLRGQLPENSQARADFATFLALMYVRTPAMRRMHGEGYGRYLQILVYAHALDDRIFERTVEGFEREHGEPLDPEMKKRLRRDMLDPSGYALEIPKEKTFGALNATDKLAPIFYKMRWSLLVAEHGYFITSDNPLVRIVEPRAHHRMYGDHGFLNKTAEVSFPLSPKLLLILSWDETALERGVLGRKHVTALNQVRAAYCDRYLYAHVRDKRLAKLAAEFKGSRPGMKTLGFGPKKFAAVTIARRSRPEQSAP
jgi:hypothetical protein